MIKSTDRGAFLKSKPVLVFNGAHILISIFRSVRSTSEFSGVSAQSISFACNGKQVSAGNFFFRHLHPDVEIEPYDIGSLMLKDYDSLCRVKRPYHTARAMTRKKNYAKSRKKD